MLVSKRTTDKWKAQLEHGDYSKIQLISGMNRIAISRALNRRIMAQKTFHVLQSYFEGKKHGKFPEKGVKKFCPDV